MGDALVFFANYGQPGLFVGGAFVLFRYLLTRHDKLAREHLEELKGQVRALTRRALRAELFVRAYQRAGYPLPTDQVEAELRLATDVAALFPEYHDHEERP